MCPQEVGYRSDPTHVRFTTGRTSSAYAVRSASRRSAPTRFPFPRAVGKVFIYNEFCVKATLEGAPA